MTTVIGKKEIPVIIVALLSLLMIVPFFINAPALNSMSTEVQRMLVPIAGFALILGGLNVTLRNITKISKRSKDWQFSIVLLATFVFFLVVSLIPSPFFENLYTMAYVTVLGKVNEAVMALIAVFMATMAYRGFKIKNFETLLFTLSCLVVMIANAPIGEAVWAGAPGARNWIMDYPNMAGMRALNIGIALGIMAYGVRTMMGHERIALGDIEIKVKKE
ncbi:MAG: hypothetical protein KKD44_26605 [Proteobacteria bacterium]|nr:hypothetical protein [Pseudomonadota bacterium]